MEQTKLNMIVNAIDSKKCEDIQTYNVEATSPFFSYVVIATMSNIRQANGVVDEIQKNLSLIKEDINHVEGNNTGSEWVLIDCNDIIVHIFTEKERSRVNIEELLAAKKKKGIK